MNKEDLKDYIKKLYGSQQACANALGVDRRTVYRWINENPKRMIKYVDTIVKTSDTTKIQIIGEILYHDEELNG
jgi:DNA invertase Pin-like site-specific DNA recombinase|tara:strand:- start:206 stop:427 length:222 start_codon:yes stop_codon:yes gene_type:complete